MIEYQCKRCGSSVEWIDCDTCGASGYTGHDCGEDCCVCADPEDNIPCESCEGTGSYARCLSGWDWCEDHPLPGRDDIEPHTPEGFETTARGATGKGG